LRFESDTTEALEIVREIAGKVSPEKPDRVKLRDIAILFRTNEQPRAFEVELRRQKVPYVLVGGQSFFDRKEVRDVLAYLKVLANPRDEVSLLRIINTPRRGISDAVVETLLKRAVAAGTSLWTELPAAITDGDVPHHAGERVEAFRRVIERYRARITETSERWADVVTELLSEIDYKSELTRVYKNPGDAEARWESVGEVVNGLEAYRTRTAEPSLREFLDETALTGREESKDDEERKPAVTLMTLHSAKGLEFPHVYMVGMEEGLLPHRRTIADSGGAGIDEERRLAYVGVTRAKDYLTLSYAKARMKWGKERPEIPSRFMMEMRGQTELARRAAEAAEKLFCDAEVEDQTVEGDPPEKAGESNGSKGKRARPAAKVDPKKAVKGRPAARAARSVKATPKAKATPRSG
jgi:DNA helicase-2/ATP-dependent DNA helicase PcrA